MYIIEKLAKIYLKYSKKEENIVLPSYEDNLETEDVIKCRHRFMPIDSTGEILACSKCGFVISRKRLEQNRNIFKNY